MSDFLVEIQEKIAAYPPWLVALAGGAVLALVLIILAKLFRVAAVVLFLAALGLGGWLAYRAFIDPADGEAAPRKESVQAMGMMIVAMGPPLSCQRFQARCNSRQ